MPFFLTYGRNSLPEFFQVGLNVCLSTDDPLQFHFIKEPLLEEYSVAAHISCRYTFENPRKDSDSKIDLQTPHSFGFEMEIQRHWLGQECATNVPNTRLTYRYRTLVEELQLVTQKVGVVTS
ncbi:hypothetical protein EDC04DRAFT_2639481 [Pisolithus marmoratus]|nr:hypothetical protein EDC04DRAFT_2639481 [Pisolithus marmoratus]